MKKLYDKSELAFALMWIGIYCAGMSVFDEISRRIGVESFASAVFAVSASLFLFFWLKKQGKLERFGLCKPTASAKAFLFYIPLIAITSKNLWGGVTMHYDTMGTVCFIVKMLCVGFLEELIFRGLLFQAMAKDGVKSAIIVSSLTFGIGHIVNLINGSGAELLPNLLQVMYAMAVGFAFVMIYCRTGSLMPCIMVHSVFNGLSAFANDAVMTPRRQILSGVLLTVIAGGYALYLALAVHPEEFVPSGEKTNINYHTK